MEGSGHVLLEVLTGHSSPETEVGGGKTIARLTIQLTN
jgi:hypothetical protein